MPTIEQSQQVNLEGWTQSESNARDVTSYAESDPQQARNPLMHAAMPIMAAAGDALGRQFYGRTDVPTTRTLPPKKGGGA